MAQRPWLPGWYKAIISLLAILFIGFSLFYWLGAGGVRVGGSSISFDREHDYVLLEVNDTYALYVWDEYISVVEYEMGIFPFCPLCGVYESSGGGMGLAEYRDGDWFYQAIPDSTVDYPVAFNVATGEKLVPTELKPSPTGGSQPPPPPGATPEPTTAPAGTAASVGTPAPTSGSGRGEPMDDRVDDPTPPAGRLADSVSAPSPVAAFYAAHGLVADAAHALTVESLGDDYEPLSTINESCMIFTAAFIFLFLVMGLIGLVYLIIGLVRRSRRSA